MKAREFDLVIKKFGFKTRDSGDLLAWFECEGKVVARTRRSKGSGDLPMQHSIRQQMKLTEDQLRSAISCSLDRDGYVEILRAKGII